MRRSAFTLFEIAISLALIALVMVTTAMVFPVGLKAQMNARFQLYASAKAMEMVETFVASHTVNSNIDVEAPDPWEVPVGYRCLVPDFETRLSSHGFGIMPLPPAIAARLDSDGDEARRILDEGGQLYYSQPLATTQVNHKAVGVGDPNDAQKLVFAVAGYAQHNALQVLPWKAWPYYASIPSPPVHGHHPPEDLPAGVQTFPYDTWPSHYCWETMADPTDPHMAKVFEWTEPDGSRYGFKPYAYDAVPDEAGAVRYLQAALWYCERLGLPSGFFKPMTPTVPTALTDFSAGGAVPPYKQVQAMRFLSHAATCMTRWKDVAALGGSPSSGPGFAIQAATIDTLQSPAIGLTHDLIVWYHESCHHLAMRYASSSPYDWGAPRPLERATMMDCPLIEWDLFTPPSSGTIAGSAGITARQWRPVAATPISNIGRSFEFPDRDIGPIWGSQAHATLTMPFAGEERCRQLVFWAVDWQAYIDAETAPSAPVDASRYPIAQPMPGLSFEQRMTFNTFLDPCLFAFRNPEKAIAFREDVSAMATGTDITALVDNATTPIDSIWDRGLAGAARFSGLYGADRNANQRLDRGQIPESVRMRAQFVARFNFYDPRIPLRLR